MEHAAFGVCGSVGYVALGVCGSVGHAALGVCVSVGHATPGVCVSVGNAAPGVCVSVGHAVPGVCVSVGYAAIESVGHVSCISLVVVSGSYREAGQGFRMQLECGSVCHFHRWRVHGCVGHTTVGVWVGGSCSSWCVG